MTKVSDKNPLISVVIPVYNVEEYIERCVDSVISQTYKNIEIILVDDGSPDNCPKICDDYAKKDKRVKVIHKKNGGLSDARNAGINIAKGKYISFIDSDDYVEKEYIKVLYETLIKYNADMSISSHEAIYDNGTIIDNSTNEEEVFTPEIIFKRILYSDGIDLSAWAKLYKIELFSDIKYPVGRIFEDAATTYKLIDKSQIIAVKSVPTYKYMIRSNSISNCSFSPKKMDLIISTKEMCDYIKKNYPALSPACDRRLAYAYLSTLSQLANTNDNYPKEKQEILDYIKLNGKELLKDKSVPKRDKLAIISLKFGYKFYKFSWTIYKKITGRS